MHRLVIALVSFAFLTSSLPVQATDQIVVVVSQGADDLEHFAAHELASQFRQLFDARVVHTDVMPEKHDRLVLVGGPPRNAAVQIIAGDNWPQLSDQGFVLRSFDKNGKRGVIVGGDSPVSTLWAVYELGHRFGIRYLLREDIYPAKQVLKLTGFDAIMEPDLKTRTWRTINDFVTGPVSWDVTNHKKQLLQLAKMKFNSVMLSFSPWQPFVHYEFRGVKKQTAQLWIGERFQIDSDTPGRVAFANTGEFTNPDFAGAKTYQETIESGTEYAKEIIREAKRLGMSVGISISPLEFPREFKKALPELEDSRGLYNLNAVPGAKLSPDDRGLQELVATKVRAYIETYPDIDQLYLVPRQFPAWRQHVDSAWRQLSRQIGAGAKSLESLVKSARNRSSIHPGNRAEGFVQDNLVTLAFLSDLFADSKLLQRADGNSVVLTLASVDPAIFPFLDRVLPPGASTLNFDDYTVRQIVENKDSLTPLPADKVRRQLVITLADDHVGILSQSTTRNISTLIDAVRAHGWDGFSTRYGMLTESEPTVYYMSRAAWDKNVTARRAHDDLFTTITGKQSSSDRLWLAFGHIEAATNLTESNDVEFAFPVSGMLMKHYHGDPEPAWWEKQVHLYTQAMIEFYRAGSNTHLRAGRRLFYWGKRGEYVLQYLGTVKAVRAAGIAKKQGDTEEAIAQLEAAIESLYNAMDTLSDVVEDQSDLALIATLNQYAYRPLMAEYERLIDGNER